MFYKILQFVVLLFLLHQFDHFHFSFSSKLPRPQISVALFVFALNQCSTPRAQGASQTDFPRSLIIPGASLALKEISLLAFHHIWGPFLGRASLLKSLLWPCLTLKVLAFIAHFHFPWRCALLLSTYFTFTEKIWIDSFLNIESRILLPLQCFFSSKAIAPISFTICPTHPKCDS